MSIFFSESRTQVDEFTLSADGNTDTIRWRGGKGTFGAQGTFGGGTVKLQMSMDSGTTWIEADQSGTEATFTSNGFYNFEFAEGVLLRANLAGATAPDLEIIFSELPL